MEFKMRISAFVLFVVTITVIALPGCNEETVPADTKNTTSFQIAMIGDIPRLGDKRIEPDLLPFMRLRDEINAANPAFTIHVGDFNAGNNPCTDACFERWYNIIQTFTVPFMFLPGDNEWTDCHTEKAGGFDPVERLWKLRDMFYATSQSLGKHTLSVERQSDSASDPRYRIFVENFRWVYGDIMFAGLNVQGSNNNFGRTPEMDEEFKLRNEAVNSYMRESFAQAKKNGNRGIMICIQANPQFERKPDTPNDGFRDFRAALEEETLGFDGKPVALLHGDSHYFRIDKPMKSSVSRRRIENFTRVETFGSPDVHWILATVDLDDPNLFRFEQRIVKGNAVDHTKP